MCEKCQDRGFTEREHGLIRVFCDCKKGQEVKAEVMVVEQPPYREAVDDSNSGTGRADTDSGSADTGKPKLKRKQKAKKRAAEKSS